MRVSDYIDGSTQGDRLVARTSSSGQSDPLQPTSSKSPGKRKPVMEEPCSHAGTTTIRCGGNGTSRCLTCASCDQHLVLENRCSGVHLWRYFVSVILYLPRGVQWCEHNFCQGGINLHARRLLRENRKAFSKSPANLKPASSSASSTKEDAARAWADLHTRRSEIQKAEAKTEAMKDTIGPLKHLPYPNVFPQIDNIDKTDHSLSSEKSTCGKFSGYTFAAFVFLFAFFIRYLLDTWIRCA